MLHVSKLICS